MHDTLSSLVERALTGNERPLEFYLRDQSRLPGPRANMELANDVSSLLAASVPRYADNVWSLLNYFANGDRKMVTSNTPSEFIMLCGILASGTCAAIQPAWRMETLELLKHYACSPYQRVREGVALAYRSLLEADSSNTIAHLMDMAREGNYLQQRAAIATIAEPAVLFLPENLLAALQLQSIILERLHGVPPTERRNESFRVLRRALSYTLSVIVAAAPEQGFALMRECASWDDPDIVWVLRANLKKKRLAKFARHAEEVSRLLA